MAKKSNVDSRKLDELLGDFYLFTHLWAKPIIQINERDMDTKEFGIVEKCFDGRI